MQLPSDYTIEKWLNESHDDTYFDELKKTDNQSVLSQILDDLSPYHRPHNLSHDVATKVQYLRDCYDVYDKSKKSSDVNDSVLYRLSEVNGKTQDNYLAFACGTSSAALAKDALKETLFSKLISIGCSSNPKDEIKKLSPFKEVLASTPNPFVVNYIDILVDNLIFELRDASRYCDDSCTEIIDAAGKYGRFGSSPTQQSYSEFSEFVITTLLCSDTPDVQAQKIKDELKSKFNWTATNEVAMNKELKTQTTYTGHKSPIQQFDDTGNIIERCFDLSSLQHDSISQFYGVSQPTCVLMDSGRIYTLGRTGHTLDKNMVWMHANIEKGRSFRICSEINDQSIYRKSDTSNSPSAFAVELSVLVDLGYTLEEKSNGYYMKSPVPPPSNLKLSDVPRDMSDSTQQQRVVNNVTRIKAEVASKRHRSVYSAATSSKPATSSSEQAASTSPKVKH